MPPRPRILIVDDEEDTRRIIRMVLRKDYELVEAHDGLDALSKIDSAQPDFIIMDVMMPLMDGFRTTASIRQIPQYENIKVLFLSGLTDKEAIKKGYEAGADLYLTKPFDPERLKRNIDVFFESNEAAVRPKRYKLEQLEEVLRQLQEREALRSKRSAPPTQPPPPPPKPAPAPPAAVATPAAAGQPPARSRVMVVDDNEEIVHVAKLALSGGYEVVSAVNGLDAIEKIVHCEPDIIVLDALMPKLSGYQLCQSLRRNSKYRNSPIIFISVKASPKDREYARQLGANAFLPKPFDPADLARLVDEFAQAANYAVRPKKMTIKEINRMEVKKESDRHKRQADLKRMEEAKQMKQFIREEMD